jgi:hypothetical protein
MDLERRMKAAQGLDKTLIKRAITLDAHAAPTPASETWQPASAAPTFKPMPALPDSAKTDYMVRHLLLYVAGVGSFASSDCVCHCNFALARYVALASSALPSLVTTCSRSMQDAEDFDTAKGPKRLSQAAITPSIPNAFGSPWTHQGCPSATPGFPVGRGAHSLGIDVIMTCCCGLHLMHDSDVLRECLMKGPVVSLQRCCNASPFRKNTSMCLQESSLATERRSQHQHLFLSKAMAPMVSFRHQS